MWKIFFYSEGEASSLGESSVRERGLVEPSKNIKRRMYTIQKAREIEPLAFCICVLPSVLSKKYITHVLWLHALTRV